jgi:wyosine [tRNA(Phe)-imidazoG37] synthetase (radical SAM superfamily)
MMLDKETIKFVYLTEVMNRRKQTYMEKAKEIVNNYKMNDGVIEENQINSFVKSVMTSKNLDAINEYLLKRINRSEKNKRWAKTVNGIELGKAILQFITSQIAVDAESVIGVKKDCTEISEGEIQQLINETTIRLASEFLCFLLGYYRIKKKV